MEVKKPEPGYEWLLPERVAKYLNEQEGPELRTEIAAAHGRMIELLGLPGDASFRFVDLGAGAGAVSASLMSRFPKANGLLADMSAAMMERGRSMLEPYAGRYRYVEYDMNSDSWPSALAGPVAAVVSARAIHHLSADRKAALFGRVRLALAPGGAFINWDNMRDPAETRVTNRTTIAEYLDLLAGAGFVDTAAEPEGHRAILLGRRAAG